MGGSKGARGGSFQGIYGLAVKTRSRGPRLCSVGRPMLALLEHRHELLQFEGAKIWEFRL